MDLTLDLSGLSPETRLAFQRGLQHEDRARYAVGVTEQLRMKQLADREARAGSNRELGPLRMVMSCDQGDRARREFGPLCFADPEFVPWLLKREEVFRVKETGTRIQSGWTAPDPKHTHA